jgi:hypothetical protein
VDRAALREEVSEAEEYAETIVETDAVEAATLDNVSLWAAEDVAWLHVAAL